MMQVTVPQGMGPGHQLQIQGASGPMLVTVPAGVGPGGVFQVKAPRMSGIAMAQPSTPMAQPVAMTAQPAAPIAQPVAQTAQPAAPIAQPVARTASAAGGGSMTSMTQQQVQVQVPVGLGPGAALKVAHPTAPGQHFQVVVPAGLKAGDVFAVALPAAPTTRALTDQDTVGGWLAPWITGSYEVEGQLFGQPHSVLAQMQGVPMVGVVPQSYRWERPTYGGHTADHPYMPEDGFEIPGVPCQLFVPGGTAPGQQVQFMGTPMQGLPTAPKPPDDEAVVQYEQLLAGATRIVIEDLRTSRRPTKEVSALRLSGSAGELGSLYLVVNGDPDAAGDGDPFWHFVPNMGATPLDAPAAVKRASCNAPYAGSAELRLSDGRVVMQLANPAWRAVQNVQWNSGRRPQVQMMDRADVVRVTDETELPPYSPWCCPLDALPRTHVSHPLSSDETLKRGYKQVAPTSINTKSYALGYFYCVTCPVCFVPCVAECQLHALMTVISPPDVHYQLQEVGTGRTVDGVLYSEKGMPYDMTETCGPAFASQTHGQGARDHGATGGLCRRSRIPTGDTLAFAERVPLQVRKDMLAVLVYRLTMASLDQFLFDSGGGGDTGDAPAHQSD